jgi:uncharacterized membrane protein
VDLSTGSLLELLHVLLGFWFTAGLLGRNLAMAQAARAAEVGSVSTLAQLAGYFDRLMVMPASLLVPLAGIVTALEQDWPLFGFIEGASSDWLLVSLLVYVSIGPLVPAVFLPSGKRFDESLKTSVEAGEITPSLRAALNDKSVRLAHAYELLAIGFIIFLMVTKPF